MKPADEKSNTYIDSSKEINNKDPNFKMVILLEYQNIKISFQRLHSKLLLRSFCD